MNIFEFFGKLSSDESLQIVDIINSATNNFVKFGEIIIKGYIAFNNWWQIVYPKLCEVISNIDTPEYTEDDKKELIKSYKKWGKYGWTINSQTKLTALSSPPNSLEDANQKMGQYCTRDNIIKMKDELINHGINQADLEEALFCFDNGKHKASSIILFALIDHELISKGYKCQPQNGQQDGKYKTGFSAVCAYKKDKEEEFSKSLLLVYLHFINIIQTLMTLFENGNNFTNEPNMVNRNFIDHGMSNRTVTEIDCFKVWSALYSLAIILPKLEEIKL